MIELSKSNTLTNEYAFQKDFLIIFYKGVNKYRRPFQQKLFDPFQGMSSYPRHKWSSSDR